jgi:hypothetical protein
MNLPVTRGDSHVSPASYEQGFDATEHVADARQIHRLQNERKLSVCGSRLIRRGMWIESNSAVSCT